MADGHSESTWSVNPRATRASGVWQHTRVLLQLCGSPLANRRCHNSEARESDSVTPSEQSAKTPQSDAIQRSRTRTYSVSVR
jgi:hypothetical protein